MIIPEYVAQQPLDTERRGMPQPQVFSGMGEGLQSIGASLNQLSDHIQAKQDQRDQTNANYAYEDWAQRSQVTAKQVIEHAPVDGSGVHDTGVLSIQEDAIKVANTLSQKYRDEFLHRANITTSDHSIALADAQYKIASDYHAGKIGDIVNSKAAQLTTNPELYKQFLADSVKYVNESPLNSRDKAKVIHDAEIDLSSGKFRGDLTRDPAGIYAKIGVSTKVSLSGGSYSDLNSPEATKARAPQFEFAWQEINTTHAAIGSRLLKATTLEQAVSEGLKFEGPKVANFDERLKYAKSVLDGTASKPAMAARYFFEGKGMSAVSASGFVGNFMGESGPNLDPAARNKKDGKDGSDSVGIAQWNGERAKALQEFLGNPIGHDSKVPPQSNGVQTASIDPAYANLPIERRLQMANQADVYIKQQEVSDQNIAKVSLSEDVPHALDNLRLSGQTDKEPTYSQFVKAEPETADAKYAEYQSNKRTALITYGMQGKNNAEIDAQVQAARDKATTGNASVNDIQAYSTIHTEANRLETETKRAANETKQAWEKDPFTASLSYSKNVKDTWQEALRDPTNTDKRRMAVRTTLEAQKSYGVATEDMQLLPTDAVAKMVSVWKDPNTPTPQKQAQIMSAIDLAPDSTSKYVMFNQLVKAGFPPFMQGAIDAAIEHRDPGVVNRLFEAGLVDPKAINTAESDSKIRQASFDSLFTGKGAIAYGTSFGLAAASNRMGDAADLVYRAAKLRMAAGTEMDPAISSATEDLLGKGEILDTSFGGGTKIKVIAPEGVDTAVLTRGFEKAADDLKVHMDELSAKYLSDAPQGEAKIAKKLLAAEIIGHMYNSTFVKVEGGYALRQNDSNYLIPESITNANPKIFTLEQLLGMGETVTPTDPKYLTHPKYLTGAN